MGQTPKSAVKMHSTHVFQNPCSNKKGKTLRTPPKKWQSEVSECSTNTPLVPLPIGHTASGRLLTSRFELTPVPSTCYKGSSATLPDFLLSKFFSPLQPMLSTTKFLLSKTFLLSQFSPPLQPMLSTTFLLTKTFLLSKFVPPSAAHAFNYIPFIKHIPFIKIFPPLCSPCFQWYTWPGVICDPTWLPFIQIFLPSAAHAFNYNILFIKNIPFITIFPPSAAHAFNYIPFIKNIPFIKIFPPLCSPCFQLQHSFYQTHSFYQNFPPSLQPMLSTTFLLSKTFLLSQFSPPLQPMLSMIHVATLPNKHV